MNWKQEAIEKLNRYDAMIKATENLPEEIKRLEQNVIELRGVQPEQLPHVTPQRGDDFMINNLMKRQELELAYKNAKSWVETTQRAMCCLNEEDKKVLIGMYVYPMYGGVAKLCQELGVEQSTVYRRRDEALYRFTLALYGTAQQ